MKKLGGFKNSLYLCSKNKSTDQHMTRQRLFSTLLFLTSMLYVHAQFADPREKFSITADVDGATNTDYYWKSDKGERLEEGRLKHGVAARVRANLKVLGNRQFSLSVSPFYHYSNKELNSERGKSYFYSFYFLDFFVFLDFLDFLLFLLFLDFLVFLLAFALSCLPALADLILPSLLKASNRS